MTERANPHELHGAVVAVLEQARAECRGPHGESDPETVNLYLAAVVVELARGTSNGFLRTRADFSRGAGADAVLPPTTEL